MSYAEKDVRWIVNTDIEGEPIAPGIVRKVLAFCDESMLAENTFEKGAVGERHSHPHTQITYITEGVFEFSIGEETKVVKKGDCLLKQSGILHGCVCLEKGILIDCFTPMREDFIKI